MSSFIMKASKANLHMASSVEMKGTELKATEPYGGSLSLTTTFFHFSMNGLAQGVGYDQRVGREVTVRGVEIKGWFTPSDTSQIIRVIVENRKKGYTAVPDETVGHFVFEALAFAESEHKFYVDDYVGFPPTVNATGLTYPTVPYTRFIPMNLKVRYDSASDISNNCLFVHMASDSVAPTHPTFTGHIRFYYTDE